MSHVDKLSPFLARLHAGWWAGNPPVVHWCPACGEPHTFAIEKPQRNGAQWSWDGNADNPTFTPSMNIRIGPDSGGNVDVCHYFLRAGRIEYLDDCTHDLRGRTVDLPPLPEGWWKAWEA